MRTVPGLRDIVRDEAAAAQLREVTVDDLLGREQVEIDAEMCAATIRGKSVLITGAAGFIASELARQVFAFGPATLHLVDVNETGLYDLERDLEADESKSRIQIWLCDIADRAQVETVFQLARPDVVFHAAAYKHIPVMEDHPDAALRVNVVGTLNVCAAANDAGVAKVVFVSTDKAVNPDNVYGATKRIGELLITAVGQRQQDDVRRRALRQRDGQPRQRRPALPAPDRARRPGAAHRSRRPRASRWRSKRRRASSSRRRRSREQGQIFILDMGEPIRTADLAEKMIRLKGLEPGRDIQIVYTGLRPGEKLHEELTSRRREAAQHAPPEDLARRRAARPSPRDELVAKIEELANIPPRNRAEIAARLQALARIDLRDTGEAPPQPTPRSNPPRRDRRLMRRLATSNV